MLSLIPQTLPFLKTKRFFKKHIFSGGFLPSGDAFGAAFLRYNAFEKGTFYTFVPQNFQPTSLWWETADYEDALFYEWEKQGLGQAHFQQLQTRAQQWLQSHPQACLLYQYNWYYLEKDYQEPALMALTYDKELYMLLPATHFRTYGPSTVRAIDRFSTNCLTLFAFTLLPADFEVVRGPAFVPLSAQALAFMTAHTQQLGLAEAFDHWGYILWQNQDYPFTYKHSCYGFFSGMSTTGYLTTLDGGQDQGLLLYLEPSKTEIHKAKVLHEFRGDLGSQPVAGLRRAPNGILYGITLRGGDFDTGTLYALDPSTQTVEVLYQGEEGGPRHPIGLPVWTEEGGLYGVSLFGGQHNAGTLYRFDLQSKQMQILHSFEGPEGAHPLEALVLGAEGWLYGATALGGKNDIGVLFGYHIPQRRFEVLWHLEGEREADPSYFAVLEHVPTYSPHSGQLCSPLVWHPSGKLYCLVNPDSRKIRKRYLGYFDVGEARFRPLIALQETDTSLCRPQPLVLDQQDWLWTVSDTELYAFHVHSLERRTICPLPIPLDVQEQQYGDKGLTLTGLLLGMDGFVYAWNPSSLYRLCVQTGEWRLLLRYDEVIE